MSKGKERQKRIFPKCFENFEMPQGAREEAIEVFRACKTWKCDIESFIPTYLEKGENGNYNISDPSTYSLSTCEKYRDIKRFLVMNSEYGKPYRIAEGITHPSCGKVQRTKERLPERKKSSHVDWWLYENAEPHIHFEMIENSEK